MTAPTRIGRYEIIRRLGKSMTEVYLAMDTVENRKVALKLIPHSDDRALAMVVEAERRGAAIQKELHTSDPRMVEIYEYGDLDGYFFVAMQFIEGRTVADDPGGGPRGGSVPRRRDRSRDLRAIGEVSLLGTVRGARRYQAVEHPPEPQRHRAPAGFRHRQNAARRLQRHRAPVRQPELLLAGAADARRGGSAVRFVGAWAPRSTKCWPVCRRTRPKIPASWKG